MNKPNSKITLSRGVAICLSRVTTVIRLHNRNCEIALIDGGLQASDGERRSAKYAVRPDSDVKRIVRERILNGARNWQRLYRRDNEHLYAFSCCCNKSVALLKASASSFAKTRHKCG